MSQSALLEPRHDKTNKMSVCPAKTQISLGIRPVWSGSSLSAWRNLGSLATHWAHSEDSDQTGRMPRLIWVIAGRTLILLVLSSRGSLRSRLFWASPSLRFWQLCSKGTGSPPISLGPSGEGQWKERTLIYILIVFLMMWLLFGWRKVRLSDYYLSRSPYA